MNSHERIVSYAVRWRARLLIADLLLTAGAAFAAFWLARALWPSGALSLSIVAAGLVFIALRRRHPPTAVDQVTRHLDRQLPILEDSATLLLADSTTMSGLAALQRQRIESRFVDAELPPLPGTPLLRAVAAAMALLLGSVVLVQALSVPSSEPPAIARASSAGARFALELLERRVEPPSYTGRPVRRDTGWAGEVEEGARVTWRVRGEPAADAVWMSGAVGDTSRFDLAGDGTATLALTATHPLALRLEAARAGDTARAPWALLSVRRDAPPAANLLEPAPRTVRLLSDPDKVDLTLLASDDYGIARAELVLTVATGKGEGVQFREKRLSLGSGVVAPAGGTRYATVLAPRSLGLSPGDELYVYAEVRDGKTPSANVTRSETVVIALADTGSAPLADLRGLLPPVAPEFFRSQRQIIIDTERLLQERRSLATEQFQFRSSGIGFDQGVLRVRYGELVGDEAVDETDSTDAAAKADSAVEALRDHARGIPPDSTAIPTGQLHRHDDEENATRLAQSVKATLKSALAEMWQAERLLRTYQPEKALPAEYRALEYLKQVQQASRAYVLRVGFEPPPIDEAKLRLSGSLSGVRDRTSTRQATAPDAAPASRRALSLLSTLKASALDAAARSTLESAGRELAVQTLQESSLPFQAMQALRTLLDTAAAPTAHQIEAARTALWRAIPATAATPSGSYGPQSSLARRFSQLTESSK